MNRNKILLVLLVVFLIGATAQAQDAPQAPQQRGGGTVTPATGADVLSVFGVLGGLTLQTPTGQPATTTGTQRGAGGRGARSGGPANGANNPDLVEEIRLIVAPIDGQRGNPVNTTLSTGRGLLVSPNSGAWWTNAAILTRLGITDEQKLKIERVFESSRQNLTTSRDNLEKEETQLARLLDAELVDRGSVTTQIYKVVQARGEMEKVNALMTLEMREVLTRAQWTQLQVQQSVNVSVGPTNGIGPGGRSGRGFGTGAPAPGTGTPGGIVVPAGTGGQRSGRGQ